MAGPVFAALESYVEIGRWHVRMMLLMPDHLHAMIAVPPDQNLARVIRSWKRYLAASMAVDWQRDFFDHRLRTNESLEAKLEYIRANPVRAGLVTWAEDWPFIWEAPLADRG